MMKTLPIALIALVSAPVLAQSQTAPTTAAAAEKPELDRIVCERQQDIGSRISIRKVCKTVREWQEERRIQREEVEGVQRTVNQTPSG